MHDKAIAAILNGLGYQTGTDRSWCAVRVANFRGYHDIPVFEAQGNWVTLEQAARELSVSTTVVQRLLKRRHLAGDACNRVCSLGD
jgi:hypothetical protein